MHTMTKRQGKSGTIDVKAILAEDEEFLRALVRTALQEVLEAGDDGGAERREGRRGGGATGLSVGLLRPDIDHAGRQTGAAGRERDDTLFCGDHWSERQPV